jgi:hypothetical protein
MYEVHSNYGSALFVNEGDAINALWLLGGYHNFKIYDDVVRNALSKNGYYEIGILSIIKAK